jgi:hypothetical protein
VLSLLAFIALIVYTSLNSYTRALLLARAERAGLNSLNSLHEIALTVYTRRAVVALIAYTSLHSLYECTVACSVAEGLLFYEALSY